MEQYEYLNGPPAPRTVAELAMRHDALVKQLADAQATIAALQARVQEVEQRRQRDEDALRRVIADLSTQLTQRTAELEAATHTAQTHQALWREACDQRDKAQAELERVRGELERAEAGYFVAERDLQGMNNKYDELRALILALPKVEGDFDVIARYRNENGSVHLNDEVKALLKHRQGMEG